MDFKQKYFAIWQEAWGLHKKYWSISADDTNLWKEFISESDRLREKYAGSPEEQFVEKLILAVINEVENVSKSSDEIPSDNTPELILGKNITVIN